MQEINNEGNHKRRMLSSIAESSNEPSESSNESYHPVANQLGASRKRPSKYPCDKPITVYIQYCIS